MLSFTKQDIYAALAETGFSENTRVEQLDMASLMNFSLNLKKYIH